MSPYEALARIGISLPRPPAPKGAYQSARLVGNQLWVAGHTARSAEAPALRGVVGEDVSVDVARDQARAAAINLLAAIEAAVGLDAVEAVAHLRGYVRATRDFMDHPAVIDGASTLLAQVFPPDIAAHARTAIGVMSLPGQACVELELVVMVAERAS
ncbi:RidA family protein [Nocardia sp. KC 131]|uniref:RidA family protein n=1 Tax=Nocardia arseniciresistens TaxID=3392119 RepID=UPI00398E8638